MLKASQAIVLDENFGPKAKEEKENMPALYSTKMCPGGNRVCRPVDKSYVCLRGLDSVPDVPHTANVSFVTEGSGVGVSKEPPVNVKVVVNADGSRHGDENLHDDLNTLASESQIASNLCFKVHVADSVDVSWETIYMEQKLYVEVPNTILPDGSKESLVTLLEYAEEELDCTNVILCFKKARTDRASLIRTFMFLGFSVVAPGDPRVPLAEDLIFLAYSIDNYDSD